MSKFIKILALRQKDPNVSSPDSQTWRRIFAIEEGVYELNLIPQESEPDLPAWQTDPESSLEELRRFMVQWKNQWERTHNMSVLLKDIVDFLSALT